MKKQLYLLSVHTLLFFFTKKETTIKLDGYAFDAFVETQKKETKKKKILYWRLMFLIALILFVGIFLSFSGFIDEGILGVFIAGSGISSLFVSYVFLPKYEREIKPRSEYRKAIFSILTKSKIEKIITQQEVFEALLIKINMIISLERVSNKDTRLKKIILIINDVEENEGKIFSLKSENVLDKLSKHFQNREEEWLLTFLERHSFQTKEAELLFSSMEIVV